MQLPKKIKISKLLKGRYGTEARPLSWDERFAGVDVVLDSDGLEFRLDSTGGQGAPINGWEIVLTGEGTSPGTFKWTLYGISPEREENKSL